MVMRTLRGSQIRASSEEVLHRVLASIRETWWLSGPPMLVWKPTAPRW
jgi:hypothetical protein